MAYIGKRPSPMNDPSPHSPCGPARDLVVFEYDGNLVFEQETVALMARGIPTVKSFDHTAAAIAYALQD